MTDFYVRSTDGSDADSGATFALAKASLAGVAAADVAGDTAFVSSLHAEVVAATVAWAFAGTAANPNKIFCVADDVEPPVTMASAGSVSTTGNAMLDLTGSYYQRGMRYFAGNAAGGSLITFKNGVRVHEDCHFEAVGTGNAGFRFSDGTRSDAQSDVIRNCTFKFAASTNRLNMEGDITWEGGSVSASSATPARLMYVLPRPGSRMLISGVDFSVLANTFNFFDGATPVTAFEAVIRNCRLPAGWPSGGAGLFNSVPTVPGVRAEMHNSDGADTAGRLRIEDYSGTMTTETVITRTGGATDGATPYSWKVATTANAGSPVAPFETCELPALYNETLGTSLSVSVEVVHDSATPLTDAEIYLVVQYLSTSGVPLSTFKSDAKANPLVSVAAVDQDSSTATWTTTGLTTPLKQKLVVSGVTAQEAGFIQARVVVNKASKTVYIDPKQQVA